MRLLLDHGANVLAKNNRREAPLHYAAKICSPQILQLLLDKGAEVLAEDDQGRTPADIATEKEVVEILQAVAEKAIRARRVAFAMGYHERLGAGSWVRGLDAAVVRMVLDPEPGPPIDRFQLRLDTASPSDSF